MSNSKRFLAAGVISLCILTPNMLSANALQNTLTSAANNLPAVSQREIYEQNIEAMKFGETDEANASTTTKYVIKQGDTIWDISSTYGIDIESIIDANNLANPDSLKIGQELIIPAAGSVVKTASSNTTSASTSKSAATSTAKTSKTVKVASRGGGSNSSAKQQVKAVWPVNGHLTSGFGPRSGGFHKGIDICAPTGTPVYAAMNGRVVFSGWDNGGYGYLVIINHGNGLETYYGHNSKLLVKVGQSVSAGQQIAKVGATGDADGSHCHFETRRSGTPVNPLGYLR